MRRDFHVASSYEAEVTEPVMTPPEAHPGGTPHEGGTSTTGAEPAWSRLRKLWVGRPARTGVEADDPLMAFDSEAAPLDDADDVDGRPGGPRRLTWVHVCLAVLALVALAQGGLIAVWLTSDRPAPPPEFGSVRVTSSPAGAPVAVDGVARGATPFTVQLSPGPHQVVIGDGADARTQDVEIGRGVEASVHVELQPPPEAAAAPAAGGLQIVTDPPGARVSVDGEARGTAPALVDGLAAGAHTVSVTSAAGTVTRRVTVQAGVTSALIIAMSPGSEFASGWLAISAPISAQVLQDGTLVGTTDTPRLMLPAGRLQIELVNTALGYREQRTVQITAGKTTTLSVDVPRGSLYVNALPWAEVWIDGKKVGDTPLGNLQLPIGTHELLLRHPELGEQKRTVIVNAAAPVRVGVDLRK